MSAAEHFERFEKEVAHLLDELKAKLGFEGDTTGAVAADSGGGGGPTPPKTGGG